MSFMPASLEAYLAMDVIQEQLDVIVPGLPRPLPEGYYKAVDRDGQRWGADLTVGNRQLAPTVPQEAPAPAMPKQAADQRYWGMMTPKFHDFYTPSKLMQLRKLGATQQDKLAKSYVARTIADNLQRLQNTRTAAVHRVLCGSGILYFDVDGNLLADATGAVVTIDQSPPTTNTTCGKDMAGSNIIGTAWNNVAAPIPGDLAKIQQVAVQRTGHRLTTAVYGNNIPYLLLANTAVKGLFPGTFQNIASAFAMGGIPAGFLGIANWVKGNEAFWFDASGYYGGQKPTTDPFAAALHQEVADNALVLLPDAGSGFYELAQGQTVIPITNDIIGANEDIIEEGFVTAQGQYGYGFVSKDPVGVKVIFGDTFLPALSVLGARWNLTPVF